MSGEGSAAVVQQTVVGVLQTVQIAITTTAAVLRSCEVNVGQRELGTFVDENAIAEQMGSRRVSSWLKGCEVSHPAIAGSHNSDGERIMHVVRARASYCVIIFAPPSAVVLEIAYGEILKPTIQQGRCTQPHHASIVARLKVVTRGRIDCDGVRYRRNSHNTPEIRDASKIAAVSDPVWLAMFGDPRIRAISSHYDPLASGS